MQKPVVVTLLIAILIAGCTGKNQQQQSKIDERISALMPETDSVQVLETSPEGAPIIVCYYHQDTQLLVQYHLDSSLRSTGKAVNGKRQGEWITYYPTGIIQSKCTYNDGLEEGAYEVNREDGKPYYRGQYLHGTRIGQWTIYDFHGNIDIQTTYPLPNNGN